MVSGINDRGRGILTTWPFLAALTLLLLNDWLLKDTFHNFVTGKISDFSGVAVIAFLLFAGLPKQRIGSYVLIISAFSWWKSPLSGEFIQFVNSYSPMRIDRVIDCTDLWALWVLPVCHYVAINLQKFNVRSLASRKVVTFPLAFITLFAIMGTTRVPTHQQYVIQPISNTTKVNRNDLFDAIATVAAKHDLVCENCSAGSENSMFVSQGYSSKGSGISMSYTFLENNAVSFLIEAWPGGFPVIFLPHTSGQEKADALRKSLKSMIAEKFEGLEYVEPLKRRYR